MYAQILELMQMRFQYLEMISNFSRHFSIDCVQISSDLKVHELKTDVDTQSEKICKQSKNKASEIKDLLIDLQIFSETLRLLDNSKDVVVSNSTE